MLPFEHVEQLTLENSNHLTYAILHEDGDYFFLVQAKLVHQESLIEISYNLDGNGDFKEKKNKIFSIKLFLKKVLCYFRFHSKEELGSICLCR